MGKKSRSRPPPPDYRALAQEQGQLNQQAALQQTRTNRPTQNTPWGSTSWQQDGQGNWTQNVSLDPADQAALDRERQFTAQQQGIASNTLNQAGQAMNTPLSYAGLPQVRDFDPSQLGGFGSMDPSNLPGFGQLNTQGLSEFGQPNMGAMGSFGGFSPGNLSSMSGYNPGMLGPQGSINTSNMGMFGSLNNSNLPQQGSIDSSGFGQFGNIDNSQLPELSGLGDLQGLDPGFGAVEAVREAMMGRMAPQRARQRDDEIQRLKSQGLTENSAAFQAAIRRLDEGDTDANQQALLGAAGEYGNIFNRGMQRGTAIAGVSGSQRAQRFNENATQADFQNRTRGQQFGEQMETANLAGRNREQMFGENRDIASFANATRGQQFGEEDTRANLANQNRSQLFGEQGAMAGLSMAQRAQQFNEQDTMANFANATRGQQFGEQMGLSAMQNQTRAQQFEEGGATADFQNQIRGQQFGEQGANAQFLNQIRGQQTQEQMAAAQLSGQLRQQGIAEQQTLRQSPLNDFLALTNGTRPGMPQMPSFMAGTGYAAPNMEGAGRATHAAQMNAFNARQQRSAALMSGLFGLGGAALGGPMGGMIGKSIGGMFGGAGGGP